MSDETTVPHRYLSIQEVADELGVSTSVLDDWIAQGLTPPVYRLPNRKLRMSNHALRDWIDTAVPHPLPSVTMAQAARAYHVTERTFRSWVRKGLVAGVPTDLPKNGRISREVLDAWEETLCER